MNQSNPFEPVFYQLFARMTTLNGLLSYFSSQLEAYRRQIEEWSKLPVSPDILSMSRIVVRDLTEWPPDGWARYYAPGPAFIVSEDEYLELLDELERNESAYTAAQAYEAFDTFLKESIAAYFFHNNSAANVDQRADTWLRGQGLTPVDEQYWTSYVRIPSTTTRL